MNTGTVPKKNRTLHKVLNFILLFLNASLAFGICSIYSFETLLPYKKIILIAPALILTVFMIIKEFKVKQLIRKLYINAGILAGFILIVFTWVSIW